MKRVTALVPAEALPDFTEHLHRLAVLHVTSIEEDLPEHFQPALTENLESRETCGKLEQVLAFCDGWGAGKRSFLESIFPAKTCATEARIRETAGALKADELHQQASALSADRDRLQQRLSALEKEAERLRLFSSVELPPARLAGLKHLRMILVKAPKPVLEELEKSCPETLAWETLSGELLWLAHPPEDAPAWRGSRPSGWHPRNCPRWGSLPASGWSRSQKNGTGSRRRLPRSRRNPGSLRNRQSSTSWRSAIGRRR